VVSKRLGHTKISTTLNIYTHLFEHADDQAAEALNVSLGGGKWVCRGNPVAMSSAPPRATGRRR
jgi:hypothetical protein